MSDQKPYTPSGMPLPPSYSMGQAPSFQAPPIFHAPAVAPLQVTPSMPTPQVPQTIPLPQPVPATVPAPQQVYRADSPAGTASTDEDDAQLDDVWISKAREVVEKTQYDPHLQSNELSRVKAGYLRSRYNKDIKFSEDQS